LSWNQFHSHRPLLVKWRRYDRSVCYIGQLVSDPASNSAAADTVGMISSQTEFANTKQHLLAALLSAFMPGAGQLLLAQRRKGIILLFVWIVIVFCIWPLRLPRFLAGFDLIVMSWVALSLYGACTALLEYKKRSAERRTLKGWLWGVPLLTYLGFNAVFTPLFLLAGFRALEFNSSATETTLLIGDHFIIDKTFYHDHSVNRNDLVVLRRQEYQTVKRVIAIGGDTLEAKNRQIIVNGRMVEEPFIRHTLALGTNQWMDSFGPLTVAAGKYFVMGDNRDVSLDSRSPEFGLLDPQAITGRPLYIYRSPIKHRIGKKLD
jgi:signal peptidase I